MVADLFKLPTKDGLAVDEAALKAFFTLAAKLPPNASKHMVNLAQHNLKRVLQNHEQSELFDRTQEDAAIVQDWQSATGDLARRLKTVAGGLAGWLKA